MSTAKEIRNQIRSINNTKKITSAMEMVAASKMRKAQDRMLVAKPYATKIRQVVGHLAHGNTEYRHLFLEQREIQRSGLIVVTTDRGLCGGLNTNLLRLTVATMKEWHKKDLPIDLSVIGSKGFSYFKRLGGNIISHAEHLGDTPSVTDLVGVVKSMLNAYKNKTVDYVGVVYNQFISTMSQKPTVLQLLPLVPVDEDDDRIKRHWDYLYEPDAKVLIELLLQRYIETQVYQAVVENFACEQAARMVAMKNAAENASALIDDLQLMYNKARQAAITREIAEIVGGAEAV
ncbi:MAG: F0F1 ATP synthase subunit gamma [Gammaproteobacteria bacterium]